VADAASLAVSENEVTVTALAFYGDVSKTFEEDVLPREVSVGVKLLKISMDLTDIAQEPWTKPLDSDSDPGQEFDERVQGVVDEYRKVEREVGLLTGVEARAYSIECARLCTQLREVGYLDAEFEEVDEAAEDDGEGFEEENEYGDSVFGRECGEENCLGEVLVRKVPGTHRHAILGVRSHVRREECLECRETLDNCTCEAC
jgi:hypothetical protein